MSDRMFELMMQKNDEAVALRALLWDMTAAKNEALEAVKRLTEVRNKALEALKAREKAMKHDGRGQQWPRRAAIRRAIKKLDEVKT